MHMHGCMHALTHHLPAISLFFISSPKALILGFSLTPMIMSQTALKASSVHLFFKQSWRISFCSFVLSSLKILLLMPSSIAPIFSSSMTTVLASMSAMNRSLKWSSTCSAAWEEKTWSTQTSQWLQYTVVQPHPLWSGQPKWVNGSTVQLQTAITWHITCDRWVAVIVKVVYVGICYKYRVTDAMIVKISNQYMTTRVTLNTWCCLKE